MSPLVKLLKAPIAFVWIGFVCAISFMEAWLKFTAPGVSLTDGLAIGQIVFGALNKVECIFLLSIQIFILLEAKSIILYIPFYLVALILLVQTLIILPQLSARIDIILGGSQPSPSNLHSIYIACEIGKVIFLLWFGLNEIKK